MKRQDDKILEHSQAILDRHVQDIDDRVVARLRAARLGATEAASRRDRRSWLQPVAGMVAATLVIGVAATVWLGAPSVPGHSLDDMELLASAESPEFYQELDFYLWLEARQSRAG